MKKSALFSAVFLFCFVCAFAGDKAQYIKDHPVITAGYDAREPYGFSKKGVPAGYFVDYLDKTAAKAGFMVSYTGTDKPSDIILSVYDGTDAPKDNVITILTTPVVIVVRDTDFDTKTIDKLNGKEVAVVRGSYADELISKGWPQIKRVYVNNIAEGLKDVVMNKAYAVFAPDAEAAWLIKRNSLMGLMSRGVLIINGKPVKETLAVTVTDASSPLYSMLKDAEASLSAQEKGAISTKWVSKVTEPSKRPADLNVKSGSDRRFVLIGALIVLIAVAAFFVRRRRS